MMINFILIYKRDSFEVKIKIYHQIMRVIIKDMFWSLFLYIIVWLGIALKKVVVKRLLIMYIDRNI